MSHVQIHCGNKVFQQVFLLRTFLWMVLGLTSVTTMSRSRANTSVSFGCTNTDASIPAERSHDHNLCLIVCRQRSRAFNSHFSSRVRTLDSDVSDATAVITHLHMETTQHGDQLEIEYSCVLSSFRYCRERESYPVS